MTREQLQAVLETTCPTCNGDTIATAEKDPWCYPCSGCGRRGKVLTEAGEYLMELLKVHMDRLTVSGYGGMETAWCGELEPAVREVVRGMVH